MAQPTDHLRRSFIYRQLSAAGAEFIDLADAAIANKFRTKAMRPNLDWRISLPCHALGSRDHKHSPGWLSMTSRCLPSITRQRPSRMAASLLGLPIPKVSC